MDWALVLASQGIGASIEHEPDGAGWGLTVAKGDHEAAVRSIRLYRLENRYWHWRQPLVVQGVLWDWKVLFWVAWTGLVFFMAQTSRPDLMVMWRMDNAAVRAGDWWRLLTAIWLHTDIAHLALNLTLGTVLIGLAMGRYGAFTGLGCSFLAGAGGNVAGLLIYPASHLGVGASGMVLGGLGLLAAQSLRVNWRNPVARSRALKGVIAGVLLFVMFGLSPEANVDVIAHLGGFVSGFLLGAIIAKWKWNRKY